MAAIIVTTMYQTHTTLSHNIQYLQKKYYVTNIHETLEKGTVNIVLFYTERRNAFEVKMNGQMYDTNEILWVFDARKISIGIL